MKLSESSLLMLFTTGSKSICCLKLLLIASILVSGSSNFFLTVKGECNSFNCILNDIQFMDSNDDFDYLSLELETWQIFFFFRFLFLFWFLGRVWAMQDKIIIRLGISVSSALNRWTFMMKPSDLSWMLCWRDTMVGGLTDLPVALSS